jgi:membrane protein involved in colicin uptake
MKVSYFLIAGIAFAVGYGTASLAPQQHPPVEQAASALPVPALAPAPTIAAIAGSAAVREADAAALAGTVFAPAAAPADSTASSRVAASRQSAERAAAEPAVYDLIAQQEYGARCATENGICKLEVPQPVGSTCICPGGNGGVRGTTIR